MSEASKATDGMRDHLSSIFQSLVTAALVAMMLWVGNTMYEFSQLIAVNIDKTQMIIQRIEKLEDHLEAERQARVQFQIEVERRIRQ